MFESESKHHALNKIHGRLTVGLPGDSFKPRAWVHYPASAWSILDHSVSVSKSVIGSAFAALSDFCASAIGLEGHSNTGKLTHLYLIIFHLYLRCEKWLLDGVTPMKWEGGWVGGRALPISTAWSGEINS